MPGSLTSSINSSESETATGRRAVSAGRSVYLHAAAVADIPSNEGRPVQPAQAAQAAPATRALSADARPGGGNLAAGAGAVNAGPPPSAQGGLKGSKKISRSISLLAPWKPRPVKDRFEIHYDNSAVYSQAPATSVTVGKPPRPPLGQTSSNPPMTVSSRPASAAGGRPMGPNKSKSVSSHDLLVQRQQEENDLMVQRSQLGAAESVDSGADSSGPPKILIASQQKSTTMPAGGNKSVSRSQTMPKDTRLAGWFKKRKRS